MRRVKLELLWAWLCLRARIRGVSPDKLARVRRYLDISWGFVEPSYVNTLQRPRNYFPGLASQPIHDRARYPWVARLEAAAESIREEFDRMRSENALHAHPQNLALSGAWDVLYFYNAGRPLPENHVQCSATSDAIAAVPGSGTAGQAYFSVLHPGTHVAPHCGPTNTRLRCHLALTVADDCAIRIGHDWHHWQVDRCLLFDDSFEHEVRHTGNTDRVVLIVDFWHPDLTAIEIDALHLIMLLSRKARRYFKAAGANEKIGV